ncbi:MAG: hypothetical protein WA792_18450 [Pseudolabrys sp.]
MTVTIDGRVWRERQIEDWLLLILRFAITRRLEDRVAASALAGQFDSLGVTRQRSEFFSRTTNSVCAALEASDDAGNAAILKTHLQRIEHRRLRPAFEAVLRPGKTSLEPAAGRKRSRRRPDLWAGLRGSRYGVSRQG